MTTIHETLAFLVVAVFTVGWAWGIGALVFGKDPGERFWTWITVEQVVAAVQALIGIVLLLMGLRPGTWLHLVYGFGPLAILGVAHLMSREVSSGRVGESRWTQPWAIFAGASFICFGLSLRALMTGLGIG
jgi:hypothetical protein